VGKLGTLRFAQPTGYFTSATILLVPLAFRDLIDFGFGAGTQSPRPACSAQ
jgi:hypothetical protein